MTLITKNFTQHNNKKSVLHILTYFNTSEGVICHILGTFANDIAKCAQF